MSGIVKNMLKTKNKKNKVTKKQKILLIFLGIFLTLVLIELSLRVGGYVMLEMQRTGNVVESDDEYVILCLGESTTAELFNNQSTWPRELNIILNNTSEKKIKVINEGISGTISTEILSKLNENIKRYNPNVIIIMMGVNDAWIRNNYNQSLKNKIFHNIRVFNLLFLIYDNINYKIDEIKKPTSELQYLRLGWEYEEQEKFKEAEKMFKKVIEINRNNEIAYMGLGWSYRNQHKVEEAEKAFKRSLNLNLNNSGVYEGLAWVYKEKGKFKKSEIMLKKAIGLEPNNSMTYVELSILYKNQSRFNESIENLKKAIIINPANERSYKTLIDIYRILNKTEEADKIHKKILEIRLNYYNPILVENYQKIYKISKDNNIKLVVMQYPLRDIQEFKNFFTEEQQKDIIFVENRDNFEKALENASYEDLFIDRFAGDFGHCTVRGNKLIAENVADAIVKEMDIS
jgi:tetratricopeptide (TPR) repeat protein